MSEGSRPRLNAGSPARGGFGQNLLLILSAELGLITMTLFSGGLAAPILAGLLAVPLFGLTMGYIGLSRSRDRLICSTDTTFLPDQHPITRMVHMLARELELPAMPKVGIYPDQDMNAFAAGSGRKKAVVSFSPGGLIDRCTSRELMAIAAHEVARIANNDMRRMQYAWLFRSALTLYMMFDRARKFARWFMSTIGEILVLTLSRKRFWADATAAAQLRPEPMIEALQRLEGDPVEPPAARLAYARLMIRSHSREWFSTHPPIEARIEALVRGEFTRRLPYLRIEH